MPRAAKPVDDSDGPRHVNVKVGPEMFRQLQTLADRLKKPHQLTPKIADAIREALERGLATYQEEATVKAPSRKVRTP